MIAFPVILCNRKFIVSGSHVHSARSGLTEKRNVVLNVIQEISLTARKSGPIVYLLAEHRKKGFVLEAVQNLIPEESIYPDNVDDYEINGTSRPAL